MLKNKLDFISQDKSGRRLVLKDTTGFESEGIITGYGPNNKEALSILAYYFSVSRMFDSVDNLLKIDGTAQHVPTPLDIANGAYVTLTTDMFSDENSGCTPLIFRDGVLDIGMYVEFVGSGGVVIEEGTNRMYGIDFTEALKADSIIVNDTIYHIDKSINTNGNTVLYIIGEFTENADSFNIAYRSDIKILLTAMSESYHAFACKVLSDDINSPEWNHVHTAASFRKAAQVLFKNETPDYYAANDLMESNIHILKKYSI